jgi:hypothetical protein
MFWRPGYVARKRERRGTRGKGENGDEKEEEGRRERAAGESCD